MQQSKEVVTTDRIELGEKEIIEIIRAHLITIDTMWGDAGLRLSVNEEFHSVVGDSMGFKVSCVASRQTKEAQ